MPTGAFGQAVASVAVLAALNRLYRAIWLNHRYRFTTWRWAKVAAGLMVFGLVIKILAAVSS